MPPPAAATTAVPSARSGGEPVANGIRVRSPREEAFARGDSPRWLGRRDSEMSRCCRRPGAGQDTQTPWAGFHAVAGDVHETVLPDGAGAGLMPPDRLSWRATLLTLTLAAEGWVLQALCQWPSGP